MILGEIYNNYGFVASNEEVYFDALVRSELIDWMCAYEFGTCVDDAMNQFTSWMDITVPTDENNPIAVDIKSPVYNTAIRNGDASYWDFLFGRYLDSQVDGEKQRMIYGLGSSEDETKIIEFLDKTISANSGIRPQHTRYVYRAVGSTAIGRIAQFDCCLLYTSDAADE